MAQTQEGKLLWTNVRWTVVGLLPRGWMVKALFDKNTVGRDNAGETSVHKCKINYCRRLPRGWMVKVVSGTKTMGTDNIGKLKWYNFR